MADDKHIVLRWIVNKPDLTIQDAALVREAMRRCLSHEHVCVRFEGILTATPEFIAHSLGAMYWYMQGKSPLNKFEALGLNAQTKVAWHDGLKLAHSEIALLMRELKEASP